MLMIPKSKGKGGKVQLEHIWYISTVCFSQFYNYIIDVILKSLESKVQLRLDAY